MNIQDLVQDAVLLRLIESAPGSTPLSAATILATRGFVMAPCIRRKGPTLLTVCFLRAVLFIYILFYILFIYLFVHFKIKQQLRKKSISKIG